MQKEVDEINREGKQKYEAVQEELANVVEIFNRVQKQFMNSYKTIQDIVNEKLGDEEKAVTCRFAKMIIKGWK